MLSKSLLKILFPVLIVLLVVNIGLFSFWKHYSNKKETHPSTSLSTPASVLFLLPVDAQYLATLPATAPDADHLVFFLPKDANIYSIISGEVSRVVTGADSDNIQIKGKEGFWASYLIFGTSLVQEGKKLVEGEIIAKVKEGKGPTCLAGGNLGIYLFKDGQPARLTKEMCGAPLRLDTFLACKANPFC
jgi:hypothetical protein